MVAPVLVLAVGNESRGDDALGPLLARRLSGWLDSNNAAGNFEFIEEFQLQVENTLDLKNRKLVLFIDAGKQTPAPFSFYEAVPQRLIGHTSHAVAPEVLLGVYDLVHEEDPPPMFILCIAGTGFELGEPLSLQAGHHLDAVFDFSCELLDVPEPEAWREISRNQAKILKSSALL